MSPLILKMPERISEDFGDSIRKLAVLVERIHSTGGNEIMFDFSNCKFSSPLFLGGIAAIAFNLRHNGNTVDFNLNCIDYSFKKYLETIFFPAGFCPQESELHSLHSTFEKYYTCTYIPLVAFPTAKSSVEDTIREKTLSAVNVILKNQLGLTGSFRDAVYYMIDELSNNASDHSAVSRGFLFAQYYKSKNFMDLCISDGGKGVRDSYIRCGKYPEITSHSEAIKAAIQGKSTKDIPESRGYGLSTSRSILIDALKGKFMLWSGAALASHTVEQNDVVALKNELFFPGSLVALRIPTNDRKNFDFHAYTQG